MLEIAIPGRETIKARHLLLDVNGTLTVDGVLLPGVSERIERLKKDLHVTLITADTFGTAQSVADDLDVHMTVLHGDEGGEDKAELVHRLPRGSVVTIGNGANDALMVEAAALGIVVLQAEGAAVSALQHADIVFPSIDAALDALLDTSRLVATLRK
jgi:P-type E1-E2 ATPase